MAILRPPTKKKKNHQSSINSFRKVHPLSDKDEAIVHTVMNATLFFCFTVGWSHLPVVRLQNYHFSALFFYWVASLLHCLIFIERNYSSVTNLRLHSIKKWFWVNTVLFEHFVIESYPEIDTTKLFLLCRVRDDLLALVKLINWLSVSQMHRTRLAGSKRTPTAAVIKSFFMTLL